MRLTLPLLALALLPLLFGCAPNRAERAVDRVCQIYPLEYPCLELPADSFDFGRVKRGEKVDFEVELANAGYLPLKVLRVDSTCGCLVAEGGALELAPGESGSIHGRFGTAGKRLGRTTHLLKIYTNDPRRELSVVTVNAEVVTDFALNPQGLAFGDIRPGDAKTRILRGEGELAERVGDLQFRFGERNTHSYRIEVNYEPLTVAVTPQPGTGYGSFSDKIHFLPDLPDFEQITVSVSGHVVGMFDFNPRFFVFRNLCRGRSSKRQVVISSTSGEPLEIDELKCPVPELRLKASREAGDRFSIQLTVPGTFEGVDFATIVHVTGRVGDREFAFEIPVRGSFARESNGQPW